MTPALYNFFMHCTRTRWAPRRVLRSTQFPALVAHLSCKRPKGNFWATQTQIYDAAEACGYCIYFNEVQRKIVVHRKIISKISEPPISLHVFVCFCNHLVHTAWFSVSLFVGPLSLCIVWSNSSIFQPCMNASPNNESFLLETLEYTVTPKPMSSKSSIIIVKLGRMSIMSRTDKCRVNTCSDWAILASIESYHSHTTVWNVPTKVRRPGKSAKIKNHWMPPVREGKSLNDVRFSLSLLQVLRSKLLGAKSQVAFAEPDGVSVCVCHMSFYDHVYHVSVMRRMINVSLELHTTSHNCKACVWR